MKKLKSPRSLSVSKDYACYAGVGVADGDKMLYIGGPYYSDSTQIHVPLELKEVRRLRKYIVRVEKYLRSRV